MLCVRLLLHARLLHTLLRLPGVRLLWCGMHLLLHAMLLLRDEMLRGVVVRLIPPRAAAGVARVGVRLLPPRAVASSVSRVASVNRVARVGVIPPKAVAGRESRS